MKYATVCSGIEAPSAAWESLGWEPVWFSEIDAAPSKLLVHRWPQVPNYGDFTTIVSRDWDYEVPDVLIGGTPCQAFSYAGSRGSLGDKRGQLTLSFVELAHDIWSRNDNAIVVWENVPGVLNTKDNAFGQFIATLGDGPEAEPLVAGQRWSTAGLYRGEKAEVVWRVLDAQHFGVPQRRRRVFVVAYARARCLQEILFEFAGSCGDSAPNDHEGVQATAPSFGGPDEACWWNGGQVSQTLDAVLAKGQMMPEKNRFPVVYTLHGTQDPITGSGAMHALQSSGGGNQHLVGEEPEVWLRRLTPVEAERLQGFPDGWTEPLGSDTARYKAIGNSMAVSVIRWIGKRIEQETR